MVKFRLRKAQIRRGAPEPYRGGNHVWRRKTPACDRYPATSKILFKLEFLEFESNSPLIRIDFAQKRRFTANDSFKPVWYGLV
jgi:hypothetical protein